MSLSIGIVGLPNVGKSTLFNALTKNNVLAANYPFATIEPNVGIVPLPDTRLTKLAEMYKPDKVVPATVSFVDIAGIVRGASEGQGMGNKFLSHIRQSSAIAQVVRVFHDPDITHVEGKVDPSDDIDTINTELILADLQTVDSRLAKLAGEAKSKPAAKRLYSELEKVKQSLDQGKTITASGLDVDSFHDLQLLTAKPIIYVFNIDEADLTNSSLQSEMTSLVAPSQAVFLCAKIEAELMELSDTEAAELLAELGQQQSGLEQLARVGFAALGLQTYLTAGPKEVRAWTIPSGATAPEAAGVIHTDFEKGFIKAQIISYEDLISTGSESAAKAAGKVRLEGRDYVMRDGDVVEFRFNV